MKSLKLNSPALDSVKLSAILRDTLFKDAEYYSEKKHASHLHALYRRNNSKHCSNRESLQQVCHKHN